MSRFTTIRFLPPLRAFVLSYCLCCCFLREANVYTRLLCLPVCLFVRLCPSLCFSLSLSLSFLSFSLFLRSSGFLSLPSILDFCLSFLFSRLLLSSSRLSSFFFFSFFLSLSPFDYCWYSSIRTSIFAQVRNGGYRCNVDTDTTEHLSLW